MKTTREAKEHTEQVLHMSYRKEFRFNFSAPLVDLCSKKDATMKDINDVLVKQMDYIEHLLGKEREGYLTSKGNAEMSRDARARLGLTQIEMAKRLGISTIQLAKVEGGDRGFSKKVLIKLSILKGKK